MKLFSPSEGVTHNFWQNYTDLMSGLMIIFLIASLGYIVSHDEDRKIKAIIRAQKELADSSRYFEYNEQYNRFECNVKVDFPANELVRNETVASTIPESVKPALVDAGKELKDFILAQKEKYEGIDFEIIIDGRAARPKDWQKYYAFGAKLGYLRAYNLYKLWKDSLLFDNTKDYIHAAGSGYGGVGRHPKEKEGDNRTFVISVIPFLKK